MTQGINGELYKRMILNASAAIENNKQEINDLNVFPVPDGDTGTNMSLTIGAAEKALATADLTSMGRVADVTASAVLRGARGNSGVILSLLFRGFSRCLKDKDEADASHFAAALTAGVDSAYKAVMKPSEGTILTVSRMASGAAVKSAEEEQDIEKVLEKALEVGYVALADTMHQNPVLEKAGVIDAGAKGYLYILDGMLQAMRGVVIEKISSGEAALEKADFAQYSAEDIEFAYCTEFMIERNNRNNPDKLRAFLDSRGDSIVVVDDDEIIKVHIHTNDPGVVLTEALTYGSMVSIKIENMKEQHAEAAGASDNSHARQVPQVPEEKKPFGFVAVCAGKGLEEIFTDLGVDRLITGGQTMNPSTEDILGKIDETPADVVFVLPNNKNIRMAADQCVPLSDKRVIVIPTKSIPQGVSAMLAIDGIEDVELLESTMTTASKQVHTALITKAARNSVYDDTKIKKGSHLALVNDSLAASSSDFKAVLIDVAEKLAEFKPEFVSIFTGDGVKDQETDLVSEVFAAVLPDVEVTVVFGGQPVYSYIIAAE